MANLEALKVYNYEPCSFRRSAFAVIFWLQTLRYRWCEHRRICQWDAVVGQHVVALKVIPNLAAYSLTELLERLLNGAKYLQHFSGLRDLRADSYEVLGEWRLVVFEESPLNWSAQSGTGSTLNFSETLNVLEN